MPTMQSAALAACGLLLIGAVLRARIGWLQRALIPASVAGGLVGLAVVQSARGLDESTGADALVGAWSEIVHWVAVDRPSCPGGRDG